MRDSCSKGGDAGRGKKIDERTDSNPSFFFARKSERIGHSEEEKRRKAPDKDKEKGIMRKFRTAVLAALLAAVASLLTGCLAVAVGPMTNLTKYSEKILGTEIADVAVSESGVVENEGKENEYAEAVIGLAEGGVETMEERFAEKGMKPIENRDFPPKGFFIDEISENEEVVALYGVQLDGNAEDARYVETVLTKEKNGEKGFLRIYG